MKQLVRKTTFLRSLVYEPDADPELVESLWREPDHLIDGGDRLVQKRCVRTTVKWVAGEETYVIKRHRERSWRHQFKQFFCRSRAQRCWDDTWYLIDHGYPTPRPVAYVEDRLGPLRGNSWYVYQYVEGRTLKDLATGLKNQRLLRRYIAELADIWQMHARLGVSLSDGHPANFIVDATGKMWVIDLDKLQRIGHSEKQSERLRESFLSAVNGVFGDQFVVRYGLQKLDEALAHSRHQAA